MAYKLQLKRGASGSLPTGSAGEPLFTTDTNDLYIGTGASNQRYQKYIASGTSAQFLKGDGSLDSNTYYLASNPSAYIALTALTASAPLSYNNTTGAFTIAQASGSVNGFLSSTDWTTFNNKQNALTNPVTGTGTTNYLPKWTSGSAIGNSLAQDTGSSINIGTATTYPATKLVVGGASAVGGIVSEDTAGTGSFVRILGDATSGNLINYKNGTSLRFASSAADFTTFTEHARFSSGGNLLLNSTTDNGNRLQVTGNGYFSGNVGIGVVSASAKLHVYGGASGNTLPSNAQGIFEFDANGGIAISTPSGNAAGVYFPYSTDAYYSGIERNSTSLGFRSGGSVKMTLDTSGNLGLGVTPSAWSGLTAMQINQANFRGSSGVLGLSHNAFYNGTNFIYQINTQASDYYQINGQHIWNTAPSGTAGNAITFTQAMTLTANGRLLLGTTTEGTNLLDVNGTGDFAGRLRVFHSTAADYAAVIYNTSTTGEGLTIRGGSTSSHNSLQVQNYNGSTTALTIVATGAATFSSSVTINGSYLDMNGSGLSAPPAGLNYGLFPQSSIGLGLSSLYGMTFWTGTTPTERMRITAGGEFWFKGVSTSTGYEGQITNTETTFDIYGSRYGGTGKAIALWATGASESMRINYTNNILIGTTVDSGYKLDVNGTGRFSDNLTVSVGGLTTTFTGNDITFSRAGATYITAIGAGSSLYIGTNNVTDRLVIASTGAATFSSSVTANGLMVAQTGESVIRVQDLDGTNQYLELGHNGGGSYFLSRDNTSNGNFVWYTSTGSVTERMRITSGGNLLVGTTTDSGEKLQVNGDAIFGSQTKLKTYSDSGSSGIYDGSTLFGNNAIYWNTGRAFFVTNGAQRMLIKSDGIINLSNVPSSSAGLSAGDIYKDASGFLKIV